jgi:hypothetical protein
MRSAFTLAFLAALAAPAPLRAQAKPPIAEVKQFRIGFGSYAPEDGRSRYKMGMWSPVYVKVKAGLNGIRAKANDDAPYIKVETDDSEDVGTIFRTPFTMEPNEERFLVSYFRPGKYGDVKVTLHIGDLKVNINPLGIAGGALDLNTHLYVTLGERIPDLQGALIGLAGRQQPQQAQGQMGAAEPSWPRFAGFETDASLLPEYWWGYQGVDLLFLSTRDKDFLLSLAKDNDDSRARLKAIAQWVRRGGRLVIPVSTRNSDVLFQLLQSTVWQPPLPVVPPREGSFEVVKSNIQMFAGAGNPFIGTAKDPLKLALLEPAKVLPGAWEVVASADDAGRTTRPAIARMPYGLGSITYLAFPLDDAPFTTAWKQTDRVEFMKRLLTRLAPRVAPNLQEHERHTTFDLATQLQKSLDQFDVRVIPFGYVALFIVLYILVVGPLDFLLLKYVFKRLEWTWFTFPTVVIAVSIAAYYTAYAIKGHDLKINKVDVVDIDLRTNIDAKGQVRKASIYGQTFFTILSPRIQNYTLAVEPSAAWWGGVAEEPMRADMLTWLGRPDEVFGGMGARGGGQGFFRKPYAYNADASALHDVPIPVWMTKSFHAAWEVQGLAPPVEADLQYFHKAVDGKDLRIGGTLTSKLPVDLENVWLFYVGKAFPLGDLPKGSQKKLALQAGEEKSIGDWKVAGSDGQRIQTAQGQYNPGLVLRDILFHEQTDNVAALRNHALRALDLSWRLQDEPAFRDQRLREAILVARVKFAFGSAEAMAKDVNHPLPTNLWVGAMPGDAPRPPELAGILAQDTFVRIIIPVRSNQ